ncbi:hypothetical protein BSZ39_05695 [Bowdeniella nasicola]|uniref:Thioredoxin n=1 Tax=Bowdeniella nasicola TaxID=208480 RepID=A0A1Q5Q2T8_9ACTO|nr:thioredoxin family protein [Bowdeniella nasicola]OKL54153.1 hypothetical protein BSZ39_05695 [Bowdeniella nasicola]
MRLLKKLLGVDKPTVTVEATEETLAELVTARKLVLVDFWATWCGPCTRFSPIFEDVAKSLADDDTVGFVAVDIDQCPQAAAEYGIQSVPTVLAFVDGTPTAQMGPGSRAQLEAFIAKLHGVAGVC